MVLPDATQHHSSYCWTCMLMPRLRAANAGLADRGSAGAADAGATANTAAHAAAANPAASRIDAETRLDGVMFAPSLCPNDTGEPRVRNIYEAISRSR